MDKPEVLLCARDPRVIEAVEISAAALQVPLRTVSDPDQVSASWSSAPLRLVSIEVAARWEAVAPGRAFVVGFNAAELTARSAELGLPVLPLPDSSGALAAALRGAALERGRRGQIVALVGASGGTGVSTLSVALALKAADAGTPSAAVDLAQGGGGLDLVFGAETAHGLRWGDLSAARGELGPLAASLPSVRGAALVSQSRDAPGPDPAAAQAIVGALAHELDFVVIDSGRQPPPVRVDQTLIVVAADVRGIAAARMLAADSNMQPSAMVLRTGRHSSIPPAVAARSLGLDCLGAIPEDRAVRQAAELGLPPLPGPARRFVRSATALLNRLIDA